MRRAGIANARVLTRRSVLGAGLRVGIAAAASFPGLRNALAQAGVAETVKNKLVVRRLIEAIGTTEQEEVLSSTRSSNYRTLRHAFHNLAANAKGSSLENSADPMSSALTDSGYEISEIIAEGDFVGALTRFRGIHAGNLYGIAATGRPIDVYEIAIFRLANGQLIEGWHLLDELGLLLQIDSRLPERDDGRLISPRILNDGLNGDELLELLLARLIDSTEHHNKIRVAMSKSSSPPENLRSTTYRGLRQGALHLGEYGRANNFGDQGFAQAFSDRRDKVDQLLAESNSVWMRFRLHGTNVRTLYGVPATNGLVQVAEVGIMGFENGEWATGRYYLDELGLLIQLGAPNFLLSSKVAGDSFFLGA